MYYIVYLSNISTCYCLGDFFYQSKYNCRANVIQSTLTLSSVLANLISTLREWLG